MDRGMTTRWTTQDNERFRELVSAGLPPDTIAQRLGRSVDQLRKRAYMIGLPRKWFKTPDLSSADEALNR
jgi:hypothetical protein